MFEGGSIHKMGLCWPPSLIIKKKPSSTTFQLKSIASPGIASMRFSTAGKRVEASACGTSRLILKKYWRNPEVEMSMRVRKK